MSNSGVEEGVCEGFAADLDGDVVGSTNVASMHSALLAKRERERGHERLQGAVVFPPYAGITLAVKTVWGMLEIDMELLFLGTGPAEAIPRMGHTDAICKDALRPHSKSRRLRSAALLRLRETSILIDAGPDIGYQLASHRVQHIDAVLLTHAHLDAGGGLKTLAAWAEAAGRILPVYTETATQKRYGTFPHLQYRFVKSGGTVKIGALSVRFLRVRHSLQPGFPTLGFRIGKFAYASDVASITSSTLKHLQGVRTFVLDAAFWFAQKYRGHLTPDKSIKYAQWLGVEHLVLTQTGHTYPPHTDAERALKAYTKSHAPDLKITLAHDGLRLRLS